jgi:hypothetical protein
VTSGNVSASGAITAGSLSASGAVTAGSIGTSGAVTAGSIAATSISVSGLVQGDIINGNTATIPALSATTVLIANTLNVFGRATFSDRVSVLDNLTSAGNVTGANLLTGGSITATGNVSGNYLLGNARYVTGISTAATSIINAGGWSVIPSGTKLYFNFNGTNVGSLDAFGNFVVTGDVTAFGTP